MGTIQHRDGHHQQSFSVLWDGYQSDREARKARDAEYRRLVREDIPCKRWTLRDQLRPYSGLGQPDGRSCNVYMLDSDPSMGPRSYVPAGDDDTQGVWHVSE